MAVTQSLSGVMRGVPVLIRVPIAYGLAYETRSEVYPTGRPESIFIYLLLSWTLRGIINIFFFKKGKWRKKSIIDK